MLMGPVLRDGRGTLLDRLHRNDAVGMLVNVLESEKWYAHLLDEFRRHAKGVCKECDRDRAKAAQNPPNNPRSRGAWPNLLGCPVSWARQSIHLQEAWNCRSVVA
jgi:hypothetical protein